ncbi:TonB-dependent receptor domain-containing protein [Luteibaculum oceani]|uniref:TonB-dependent receptor n=1 Tax=Luteibaculum oceani TaxID=1294296 RepID=A0A5C6UXJ3_9FLAO|nr:TonB-dependent receptor [Luteibaculum oceani]TXC76961.1 TonB-dependent receptor [Luteibaculum oceani]
MKALRIALYILGFLAGTTGWAQMSDPPTKLSGVVIDEMGNPIPGARVSLINSSEAITTTDLYGRFTFNRLAQGKQVLLVYSLGYEPITDTLICTHASHQKVEYNLKPLAAQLAELEIAADRPEILERLRTIRGTMLFAAKKNDIVRPDDLVANTATNNARQVYAKVSGLNIWESDYGGNQLEIGGRGLSPSRTSNFNTRQNGYDISADPLGYPETYYSPPTDAIDRIDIVRGASSLQFGSQFGGTINFILKDHPKDKKLHLNSKQSVGSFGLFNSYNSFGVKSGKHQVFGYFNHKKSEGWRANSASENNTYYFKYTLQSTPQLKLSFSYTGNRYLAQQPGGLTDAQFEEDPTQVNRNRNWFAVAWNLPAFNATWKLSDKTSITHNTYALVASRDALGFLATPNVADPAEQASNEEFRKQRNLISDQFNNWGTETRLLQRTQIGNYETALTAGVRAYKGKNHKQQGFASSGSDASFKYISEDFPGISDYNFNNTNYAAFAEALIYPTKKLALTYGVRYEFIDTQGNGVYRNLVRAPNNSILIDEQIEDGMEKRRDFAILGFGAAYRIHPSLELFANFSQNYRSITFNDVIVRNPAFRVDPNIEDERGYNLDLGIKGMVLPGVGLDFTAFYLKYANRIGLLLATDSETFQVYRLRTNIGKSNTFGFESLIEIKPLEWMHYQGDLNISAFVNASVLKGRYNSTDPTIDGNKIELVPDFIFKTGIKLGYKEFQLSAQYSYVNDHFSDATNAFETANSISGLIPSYNVLDIGLRYNYNKWTLETGVNNAANESYFTRRATGYPGPGIIPSTPRNYYFTLGFTF